MTLTPPDTDFPTTTFVTAFIPVYDPNQEFGNRTRAWRYQQFKVLAESGIPLCVYVNAAELEAMTVFVATYPHVRVMPPRELTETWPYQISQTVDGLQLPKKAHRVKDSAAYMQLMLAKTEWLADAARQNPWGTSQFAWIDFNIAYIFKDPTACVAHLRRIAYAPMRRLPPPQAEDGTSCTIWLSGCGPYRTPLPAKVIAADTESSERQEWLNEAYWRFCGGLVVGDAASVGAFNDLCREQYHVFLNTYKLMLWEVNYWAWLETMAKDRWTVKRYVADHDDTMCVNFPIDDWCASPPKRLLDTAGAAAVTYPYPKLGNPDFVPSSAAYLYQPTTDTHWLMTRYVNYTQDERGYYHIRHPRGWLCTRNVLSRLDAVTRMPLDYHEVADPEDVPRNPATNAYLGVEDIRLFLGAGGEVRYIGTTFEFANTNCLRMIEGVVDTDTYALVQNRVVDAPEWTACEKNWTPVMGGGSGRTPVMGGCSWVYKWGPTMQVGRIARSDAATVDSAAIAPEGGYRLEIVQTHDLATTPLFSKLRGSTVFYPVSDTECLGVLHYSHEGSPRKYYHVLMMLDRATLRPRRYSDPFYFDREGIEFCIGFAYRLLPAAQEGGAAATKEPRERMVYDFWISRMDRDPMLITVPIDTLPLGTLIDENHNVSAYIILQQH